MSGLLHHTSEAQWTWYGWEHRRGKEFFMSWVEKKQKKNSCSEQKGDRWRWTQSISTFRQIKMLLLTIHQLLDIFSKLNVYIILKQLFEQKFSFSPQSFLHSFSWIFTILCRPCVHYFKVAELFWNHFSHFIYLFLLFISLFIFFLWANYFNYVIFFLLLFYSHFTTF